MSKRPVFEIYYILKTVVSRFQQYLGVLPIPVTFNLILKILRNLSVIVTCLKLISKINLDLKYEESLINDNNYVLTSYPLSCNVSTIITCFNYLYH